MATQQNVGPREIAASHASEDLIPLGELPSHLPRRRGKKVHIATCYRWAQLGVHGEVLRSVAIGGQRCTRMSWVLDWAERVAAAARPEADTIKPRRRPVRRRSRAISEATPGRSGQEARGS